MQRSLLDLSATGRGPECKLDHLQSDLGAASARVIRVRSAACAG